MYLKAADLNSKDQWHFNNELCKKKFFINRSRYVILMMRGNEMA